MSTLLDETAADVPVRDMAVNLSRLSAAQHDPAVYQNARTRQDISQVSREELEDRFLRLHEETLLLKQQIHRQDDKIKKLGTKLMRLVKDRGRMEQLAVGGAQPVSKIRDVEMEEMMEELQEKVRSLQGENEGLKQRLLVAKQQLMNTQSRRPTPYGYVQPRVNSGLKRLRDDASSPSQTRPKSTRSLEGAGRPPTGVLPRYGHNLLEEARAEIRNLENVIELQRSHMEEVEGASELLRDELRRKEAEYEERLLQARQEQTSKLRSQVSSNVTMIKLQKQLTERSNTVTELEGRFLQIQESQQTLRASHDAAMLKVDELSAQLRDERMKSLDLEKQLQSSSISKLKMEQLQERISELEQERDVLKDDNHKLLSSAFDVSRQQKWQIQEQQLKLQIAQLETALQADLVDKNEILDKIKAERGVSEKLKEENKNLQIQFLEQKQQLDELSERLRFYSRESEYDASELTEALLLVKTRKSQQSGGLGFLKDEEDGPSSVRELRAAHAETIQELQKTRNLLSMEGRISRDYKAELEAVKKRMDADRAEREQKLQRQAQLLDTRAAKISKLEAQLREIAYGTKTYVFKPDEGAEEDSGEFDEAVHLERGENVLELQIVGASLSADALVALGDSEPSTFCTYSFYLFELHATPVVTGVKPSYGFTSRYVVSVDDDFLNYLHGQSVSVELHQALGLDWTTLAHGELRLQPLLEQDGKVHGTIPLIGLSEDSRSFGSLDYWLRLRIPMTEAIGLYKERLKAVGFISTALSQQTRPLPSSSSMTGQNELLITVQCCRDLKSTTSDQPSPYVVYKFYDFPDYPTATVQDSRQPHFNDAKSYPVHMDVDLQQYLQTESLHVYVFDYKEERMDTYVGKARVPLLPLINDHNVSGEFELNDPTGLPAGQIEVSLRWRSTYLAPPGSNLTAEESELVQEEREEEEDREVLHPFSSLPDVSASKVRQAPLPKLRHKSLLKDGLTAKRVTFVDPAAAETTLQVEEKSSAGHREMTSSPVQVNQVVSEAPPAAKTTTEEEEDEESHVSEGQLVPVSSLSVSDDSDISEEIMEDEKGAPAVGVDQSESTQSDSDDCIVQRAATGRKPSERLRVEVVSLSLRSGSRVAKDRSVVRLFVEYSLLDLPTVETPLSLPKPPQGKSINYNYSKVVPVDAENNAERRRLLRRVLQGRNPPMERIRFTLVSEPPEEEEQERECEDVGVASIRIADVLERREDLTETELTVVDLKDSSEVVGSLVVSVRGL
ncbi:LOW QUALITY PROTEIN: protein fantom [Cheilinus undulatus]|uniref:LOW QUALITY PROTEIN: protein fantom n=1 Tax=Cheilinus undulatus TaxID=241271 RepID=UPI001BD3AF43|nr:LOW QUALITY PROTEIN: protein fantom [Cheilinus undulatus]